MHEGEFVCVCVSARVSVCMCLWCVSAMGVCFFVGQRSLCCALLGRAWQSGTSHRSAGFLSRHYGGLPLLSWLLQQPFHFIDLSLDDFSGSIVQGVPHMHWSTAQFHLSSSD